MCCGSRFSQSVVNSVRVVLIVLGLSTLVVSSYAASDTDIGTRYIDFDSGHDSNLGTRSAPWKHHPWDKNAKEVSLSARGVNTYIFKKGVTYRGVLEASESGIKGAPIRLTTESGWGNGLAILSGSIAYSDGWVSCPENISVLLPHTSRGKVWCKSVKMEDEPRLLWEVNHSVVTRIPIARTPNWTSINPDDPRSEWNELEDVIVELAIKVDHVSNFKVGEMISISPQRSTRGSPPSLKIVGIKNKQIQLKVTNWNKKLIRVGDTLIGEKSSTKIKKIGGTHSIIRHLVDRTNLIATDASAYKGATVWAERQSMPKADAAIVTDYDPEGHSLQANFHRGEGSGPVPHDRYFLEGLPAFLDSAGEYVFLSSGNETGMLVIRLPEDRKPNESIIEVATRQVILTVQNQSHIEVSGLGFRYANQIAPGNAQSRHASMFASAVQIRGDVTDIRINNCDFSWLTAGIVAFPEERETASTVDGVTITDSRFSDIDGAAIALGNGQGHYKLKKNGSRLIHVTVRNNRLKNIGYRTLDHFGTGSHGDGIIIAGGEVVEVSANQVDRSWGSGISVTLGSDFERGQVARPFLRGLIHDNSIIDSLLGGQDGGGINSWMGGPSYIYNNTSGNPVGCMYSRYKTSTRKDWYRRGCYGVGIYLDGQYKGYVFNNIVWGKNNNVNDRIYNSVGLNEAMGFMNTVFNNTFYRFGTGLHKGMFQHNRNYYLGNLFIDMGLGYIEQEPSEDSIDYSTLAFSHNQFYGQTKWFGKLGTRNDSRHSDIESWRNTMQQAGLMNYDTGTVMTGNPLMDAAGHDFRPTGDSPVIDKGVKVFVPWALYDVVGEWHFLRRNDHPAIINGENISMDKRWLRRDMFHQIPRNDLQCVNTDIADFENGTLEDWIPGSLRFDGKTRFCQLRQAEKTQADFDVGTNNFLIEMVIDADASTGISGVIGKRADKGYSIDLDSVGHIRVNLDYGDKLSQRVSEKPLTDGNWHHVLVDVDRANPEGIMIYIDGKLANGKWSGPPVQSVTLSNSADLLVGRSNEGLFSGRIDFLRISRGTLADAETNIEELYQWEFDGPFIRDFTGQYPTGARRDVGAIEYRRN